MDVSDAELVEGCRNGDEAAWESLVRRFRLLIFAIPRRMGLGEEDSAEVFQQVFALLIENLDRIKQPDRIQAWLVTTARRESLRVIQQSDRIKSRTGDEQSEGEGGLHLLPDSKALPDEELLEIEAQHRVRQAVESIDERCRKLLEILFFRDEVLPYSEIAERLGIKEGSIGPTRARCLEKVLRRMKDE